MMVNHADPLDCNRRYELDSLRIEVRELKAELEKQVAMNSRLLALMDRVGAHYQMGEEAAA